MIRFQRKIPPEENRILRPKTVPLMLGVIHSPEREAEEIDWVTLRMAQKQPVKLGLEIRNDYMEQETRTLFFSRMAAMSRDLGIPVVPLDQPEMVEKAHGIMTAIDSIEQGWTMEDIENRIEWLAMRPPDIYGNVLENLARAYLILSESRNLETLQAMWDSVTIEREVHMKERIRMESPSMVVIGTAHATALLREFPMFSYEPSPFVDEVPES
jgi:hypothetical protein